jgi:hypothetical protein
VCQHGQALTEAVADLLVAVTLAAFPAEFARRQLSPEAACVLAATEILVD